MTTSKTESNKQGRKTNFPLDEGHDFTASFDKSAYIPAEDTEAA